MYKNYLLAGALLCFSLLAAIGNAQIRSGTITGSAQDSSGAAIVDADVTVTNSATNVSYTTKTNGAGLFTVPYLEDGTYSVAVTKAGFETFAEDGVHLDPAATARVAATLRVGSASAKVEVTASAGATANR